MSKRKYVAISRILVKVKPLTYVEPKTSFMMDEGSGSKLVKLGAARLAEEAAKPEPKKRAQKEEAKPAAEGTQGSPSEDDDLIG